MLAAGLSRRWPGDKNLIRFATLLGAVFLCAYGASSSELPQLRPHPRIQIDAALIQQIRALRGAKDPYWTRFHNYIRTMPSTTAFPASVVNSYLLAYMVTEEQRYFEGAWGILRQGVYVNGKDRTGGLKTLLAHFDSSHSAAFLGAQYIALVAQLYDWCGSRLTPGERQDVIEWMNRACAYEMQNLDGRARFRNDGAAVVYGLASAAYATLGENPEAPKIYAWFRELWAETLRCLDIMGRGGASGEGNGYGISPTAFSFIRIANLVRYASDEDLFLSHPFFRQRLLYDAFSAYPSPTGGPDSPVPGGWPGLPAVEIGMMGGDGRRGISQESRDVRVRQNGLILAKRFAGTEEAAIWNWVFRQPRVDQAVSDVESYSDLLYYSPRPKLVKPKRLSHFDPSMGFVYIRSDWDSDDATWIAFWAGPHLDTHQHLDQGAFAIFKRRDLAAKTGHYDWDIRGPHQLGWYVRTISSNGLLIGDPHESFRGFIGGGGCDASGKGSKVRLADGSEEYCVPNDGGQRTMRPFGLAAQNSKVFLENRNVFDVARVVSFEDNGEAVSVVADITNAYNSPRYSTPGNAPKVERVYRRLVYLRKPDVLLVADTVESTKPEFEKKWLLHAIDRLEVGGKMDQVAPGESVHTAVNEAKIVVEDGDRSDKNQQTFDLRQGYAQLLVKTVFPTDFRYRKIGGREPAETSHPGRDDTHYHRHIRDFWVKDYSEGVLPFHKSMNWPPEQPIETSVPAYRSIFGPGYGRWRLEVEPVQQHKTEYFLNVLRPSVKPSSTLPDVRRIEAAGTFGAEFREGSSIYRVVFSKETLEKPQVSISR
jgi:hypothetical protein